VETVIAEPKRCVLTGIYTNLSNSAAGVNSLCDEIDLSQFCQHVRSPLTFVCVIRSRCCSPLAVV